MVRSLSTRSNPWTGRNFSGNGWGWMILLCMGLAWTRSCTCTSEALTTSNWFRPRRQMRGIKQSSKRAVILGWFPLKYDEIWRNSPPRGRGGSSDLDATVAVTTTVLHAMPPYMDGDGSVYWNNGSTMKDNSVQFPKIKNINNHVANTTVSHKLTKKTNGFEKSVPVEFVAETKLPTDVGHFRLRAYRISTKINEIGGSGSRNTLAAVMEPCVIYNPDKPPFGKHEEFAEDVPVRIHDQCLTSEVFRSQRCDCKEQFKMALEYVQKQGGAIVYLQQEGRGIGLANKVAAYSLQDAGMDTVEANLHMGFPVDCRTYGVVPSILRDLKIASVKLMTNNPRKVEHLEALGVRVTDILPIVVPQANPYNRRYLETKKERMNHANLRWALYHQRNGSMMPKKPQNCSNEKNPKSETSILNENGTTLGGTETTT